MARKEAKPDRNANRRGGRRLSLILATLLIIGVCIGVRTLRGNRDAEAQTPRRAANASAPRRSTGTPETRTSVPVSQAGTRLDTVGVAAVVNGEKITRDQLARECLRRFGKEVLESEVNRQLILQACRAKGIQITAEEVNQEVATMARKLGLPVEKLYDLLRDERGISAAEYRRDVVWSLMSLRRLGGNNLEVGSDELRKAFEAEFGPQVQVRMITSKSRAKIDKLRAKVMADPEVFGKLAKDYSEDASSAAARGIVPPIRRHVSDPKLEAAAFALPKGEISPVIQIADQFVILRCERHYPATKFSDKDRQRAMAKINDQLRDKKLRSISGAILKKLQADARIVNIYNQPDMRKRMPKVAATVNGKSISISRLLSLCLERHGKGVLEGEIQRRILTQALKRRSQQVAETDVDAEIRRASEAYGFVTDEGQPDVDKWLKQITDESGLSIELYVRDVVWPTCALKKLVSSQVQVTDADLQKGFEANYGERVEVLAIVLANQRTAQEVWRMARDNPTDQFFGDLANQYSIESVSRANSGKVPPVRRFGGQPLVETEAFQLGPDELSGVLAVGDKFIILRCLGRTRPIVDDLDAVRDELLKDLREKKMRLAMARQFDTLQATAQIDNFLTGSSQAGHAGKVIPASFDAPAKR